MLTASTEVKTPCKSLYAKYPASYEVPNTETRMARANSYAEILYEVAKAVSGPAVHTAAYAPG